MVPGNSEGEEGLNPEISKGWRSFTGSFQRVKKHEKMKATHVHNQSESHEENTYVHCFVTKSKAPFHLDEVYIILAFTFLVCFCFTLKFPR